MPNFRLQEPVNSPFFELTICQKPPILQICYIRLSMVFPSCGVEKSRRRPLNIDDKASKASFLIFIVLECDRRGCYLPFNNINAGAYSLEDREDRKN